MNEIEKTAHEHAIVVVNIFGSNDPEFIDDDIAAVKRQFMLFHEQTQRSISDTRRTRESGQCPIVINSVDAGTQSVSPDDEALKQQT
jgi:hypothetical protein